MTGRDEPPSQTVTGERQTVGFTAMAEGTAADYALVDAWEEAELAVFPEQVLAWLRAMDAPSPYQVTRLEHSLQTATRAYRAGEDEEAVVCALVHDIGDVLGPANHAELAAAVLRPYVSERNHWIVAHHGLFQEAYYAHHYGRDPNAREAYRGHPHFEATVDFCERYDQVSFDPDYDAKPLEFFEPMVRRVFAAPRRRADESSSD